MIDDFFTDEMKSKAGHWLSIHSESKICDYCGNDSWTLLDHLLAYKMYDGVAAIDPGAYPCFAIVCDRCTNMKLFNAMKSGVLNVEEKILDKEIDKIFMELEDIKKEIGRC